MTAEHERMITRIEAVIGRAKPSTVAEWRHCAVRFGVESGSAIGVLRQAATDAHRRQVFVEPECHRPDGWNAAVRAYSAFVVNGPIIEGGPWASELEAIVAVLESAP